MSRYISILEHNYYFRFPIETLSTDKRFRVTFTVALYCAIKLVCVALNKKKWFSLNYFDLVKENK
jgi:hypothetical protein